jgi:hypothetical protein
VDAAGKAQMTTRLTVTFIPTPSGTQLDLTHDRLDNLRQQFPYIAEQSSIR